MCQTWDQQAYEDKCNEVDAANERIAELKEELRETRDSEKTALHECERRRAEIQKLKTENALLQSIIKEKERNETYPMEQS